MVSVLILTLDEEVNLPRCLASVAWCDDIVVLDSGSTDRTVEIARAAGARVIHRPFDDWSSHQNWAAREIPFKHPWVYYSDADEVVTPELRDELLAVAKAAAERADGPAAYRVRYRNYFRGRWIRHCGIYPVWLVRFFRPQRIRWERTVNPTPAVDGALGRLEAHFEHHSFNKGLSAWVDKHNRYSTREAEESLRDLAAGGFSLTQLLSRDPLRRRQALKRLSFRLPMRPALRFLYMYVLRLGFLDGSAGLAYCRLLAIYEYLIVLKMEEQRRRERGLPL
jgi:glycosyltransferase involved in cell wall biosynthesis